MCCLRFSHLSEDRVYRERSHINVGTFSGYLKVPVKIGHILIEDSGKFSQTRRIYELILHIFQVKHAKQMNSTVFVLDLVLNT